MKLLASILFFTLTFAMVGGFLGSHIYDVYQEKKVLGVADKKIDTPQHQDKKILFEDIELTVDANTEFATFEEANIKNLLLITRTDEYNLSLTEPGIDTITALLSCEDKSCKRQVVGSTTFVIHAGNTPLAFTAKNSQLLTISAKSNDAASLGKILTTLNW